MPHRQPSAPGAESGRAPIDESRFLRARAEIRTRASDGEAIAAIADEVIAPSALSEDEKSSLWLYGWSCREAGVQRYQDRQAQFRRGGSAGPARGRE